MKIHGAIQKFVPELDGGDLAHAEVCHACQGVVQQVLLVVGARHLGASSWFDLDFP